MAEVLKNLNSEAASFDIQDELSSAPILSVIHTEVKILRLITAEATQ